MVAQTHASPLRTAGPRRRLPRHMVLASLIALGVLLLGSLAAVASGTLSYTIAYGDTLSELAERFDSDVGTLAELNDIENPDLIVTGNELLVPADEQAPSAEQPPATDPAGAGAGVNANALWYTIEAGDTLLAIAERFGVTVEQLAGLNSLVNLDLIVTGQQLMVAPAEPAEWAGEPDESADASGEEADETTDDGNAEDAEGAADEGDQTDAAAEGDEAPADDEASDAGESGDEAAEEDASDEAATDEGAEGEGAEGEGSDAETTEPETEEPAGVGASAAVDPLEYELHLVLPGETLTSIAEQYGIFEAQLLAANWHAQAGVTVGMILKVPPADMSGVRLVGVPAAQEQWPVASELAAAALATTYWGSAVTVDELLAAMPSSENPHEGFRGDYTGMWGPTDNYGVYSSPLAAALESFGFAAEAFYADGDASALTSRIDAGAPVVVWITYQLKPQERVVIENESGRYSLIAEQHAVLVYGYDDTGVMIVDVSDGLYHRLPWDAFLASWNLFDGMGLVVTPATE